MFIGLARASMKNDIDIPLVRLKKGREIAVRRRHPWVFSGAVLERSGVLSRGCFVQVRSFSGEVLGYGHWGTRGIAIRMLAFGSAEVAEHEVLSERIQEAMGVRQILQLMGNPDTTGFRLVHGEGDGLPGLVVDIYGAVVVVQCHSAGMWRVRTQIAEILQSELSEIIDDVVFRRVEGQIEEDDQDNDLTSKPSMNVPDPSRVVAFSENGLRFLADVTGGQKTGFFLDQRINRQKVRDYSKDKDILNAFCYTGAFSVYALAGGARSVVSVDASRTAIDLCRQNVVANFTGKQHHSEVADCFTYLEQIPDCFDMIVLDPPAFAKHQRAVQRALRGYETINALALRRVKQGGMLFTFSCSQLISRELFRDAVMRAAVEAGRFVRILEVLHQAPCHPSSIFHPEGEYLKGLLVLVD